MTDSNGEVALTCALEHLRTAGINVPAEVKPEIEWMVSHGEEALETVREHAEESDDD